MRAASLLVWAMTRILLDDYDEEGRVLPVPKVQDTPTLAAWLAKWHVGHFASHQMCIRDRSAPSCSPCRPALSVRRTRPPSHRH